MGTRSVTNIYDEEGNRIVTIYCQYDGYPEGMGVDLAKICDVIIVNGYSYGMTTKTHANGMGGLAAHVVAMLRGPNPEYMGNVYLYADPDRLGGIEYWYTITGKVGEKPIIKCEDFDGTQIFGDGMTAQEILKKAQERADVWQIKTV